MRKALMVVSTLTLLMGVATTAESGAAADGSSYCLASFMHFYRMKTETMPETLTALYEDCKPGDIIVIRKGGMEDMAIGRVCDFSKSIADTSESFLCVMSPLRSIKRGN